jgi:hypothetical protein
MPASLPAPLVGANHRTDTIDKTTPVSRRQGAFETLLALGRLGRSRLGSKTLQEVRSDGLWEVVAVQERFGSVTALVSFHD